jgi:hypothetical protein
MKKIWFLGGLFFLLLILFFYTEKKTEKDLIVKSKYQNLSQNKAIQNGDFLYEGDLVKQFIFITNPNPKTLETQIKIDSKEENIILKPQETKIIQKKIPVKKGLLSLNNKISINKKEVLEDFKDIQVLDREQNLDFFNITDFKPQFIDNNFSTYFEIKGENLEKIEEIVFQCEKDNYFLDINQKEENLLSLIVPENYLESGKCILGVVFEKIVYFTENSLVIKKTNQTENNFKIKKIIPEKISKKGGLLMLQGKGLDKVKAVSIDNGIVLPLKNLQKISPNLLSVKIPFNLDKGEYSFRIMTDLKVHILDSLKFTVYE